ncbi:RhlG family 3-oxoacyl-ACP reductase [Pseudomonadales bacterium]|jgi:NAD(P)-dependent dehydrogenase (short-subunit alcohol dehydrogenase family)|nr:RhlG family 3-oxoacyl-ACP reductase [Pseudomonadales bacterium]MDB4404915.1 RhlG family 3-oxoacyl-ACP reductase [bacterium]MDB4431019.1 RhlG family 3-oxoacyl-ACP reductase [Pseudomonadales bacterium]MDB4528981.1 RhlG family 3-oxoacyl-ACP reductase [Pseudomonadales bacterium]MDB4825230.1 RhlG family 3-oxoacyl-ACP reductase [Pseudomonadales bacterium]
MIESLFSMQNKICVVTGGSRGLGAFMAQGFLEAGAKRVYITARKAEACITAAKELSQYGECIAIPSDIATSEGLQTLVTELMSREQHIDVLVNNAGTGWGAPFGQFPEKGWDKTMDINAKSPFFLTQALAPLLKKNATADNTSSIINIGSIAGIVGNALDNFSYAISKTAIHQLTRVLSTELASDHIRVNAIAPGRFYSKMTEFLSNDQAAFDAELQSIPMRRWGEASDIAGVAIMLSSKAGAFITGQIIPVDGGTSVIN